MTVHNAGLDTATDLTLVDSLPDGNFQDVTTTQGICLHKATAQTVTCDLASPDVGDTATITIAIRAPRPGTIVNTVDVEANEPDANRANNTATETTTVLPR